MGTEQCAVVVWLVVSLMFSNLKLLSGARARGRDCLEDCDTRRSPSKSERRMGYVTDSAAAERSDGYKLRSAFFVMTPFRYIFFVGV